MIQIVFAHGMSKSPNAPFGNKQGLPWGHVPEDLAHFKKVTEGTILVMGSKTFESLPSKLSGRLHVVISTRQDVVAKDGSFADEYISGTDIPSLIKEIESVYNERGYDTISVIGGASIIESAIDCADRVYKTTIPKRDLECDVRVNLTPFVFAFPYKKRLEHSTVNAFFDLLTKTE